MLVKLDNKIDYLILGCFTNKNKMAVSPAKYIINSFRRFCTKPTTNDQINPIMYNRNPRNLERLRLDRKPTGYPLEDMFIEFWHKLEIKEKRTYVVARLIHNTKKVVVEASTDEWGISKQLHSKKDKMAYITLAKVFAERCQETGIYSFSCDIPRDDKKPLSKVQMFLNILEEEYLSLKEMPQFDVNNIWRQNAEKKPWTVLED